VAFKHEELYLLCDTKPSRFVLEFIVSKNYHVVLCYFFWFSKAVCYVARTESFHE
jgi:hypothetical protein